jgi:hypothetical protein
VHAVGNCQELNQVAGKYLKVSHRTEDGTYFLKTSTPHSLITTYRLIPLSARSMSLDSTIPLSIFWEQFRHSRKLELKDESVLGNL